MSGTGPSPKAGWTPRRTKTILEKTDLRTGLILFLIFALALFVRSYFNAEPAQEDGYQLTGGSDPYYHKRVSDYVLDTGMHLKKDPMLNFPVGGTNNRPPVFDWSMSVLGTAFSPLNGGDVEDTTWKAFLFMPALWGALTIFPVYFIGRAQFGRGAGLWGAFLFGMMSGHISHTTLALADHDAYILFFTTVAFYFFMRALMAAEEGKWVTDWLDTQAIRDGFRSYVDHNRESLGYAGLAGMSIAAVALAWKGFPYLIFIIFGYAVVQLLVNMFQGKDSMAVGVVVTITMGMPLLLSLPYYNSMNFVDMWWTAPFYIFLATLVVIAVLVPTRDLPWTMVLTSTAIVAVISYVVLKYLFVDVGEQLFSGQGYFLRTKLFDTIAEAQPPRFPVFVFAYGIATTWLTLVGAAYMVFLIYQQRQWKADYMFVLVWAITSIYMARSAVRFIYNATPVFALLAGWVVWLIMRWADFPAWWANLRRLSGGGYEVSIRQLVRDKTQGLWKATEWKHPTVAVAIGLLVIGANGLQAVDAGIPYENKKDTDVWIWDHIPLEGYLKRDEYNYSQRQNTSIYPDGVSNMYNRTASDDLRYLGITGPSFPSDYWIEGLRWLATQDNQLPPDQRPGFISWWDYGFWAIDIGEHPTVADNFQWGYQLAGNFIAAQSEEEAIALLLYRLLQAERPSAKKDPDRPFNDEIRAIMEQYFTAEEVDEIEDLMADPESYAKEGVNKKNAAIRAVRPILMELEKDELVDLLSLVEKSSGNSIRYYAVDQRLMPFSWDNTGILYAPVTLADYDINEFIEVMFVTENGETLSAEEAEKEAEKDPTFQVVDRTLVYKERFYKSMFYKAFIGWYGEDIGGLVDDGIPGLAGNLASTELNRMPGWNLSHFKLVKAIPGLTMLKYYDGAKISGQVRTTAGTPVANTRVTILDVDPQFGTIPHGSTFTDEYGYYEMNAVAGNLTIMVSQGPLESEQEMLYQTSNNVLTQERGFLISEAQATRQGSWEIAHDIEVDPVSFQGTLYWDLDDDQDYSENTDEALPGLPVVLTHNFTGHQTTTYSAENGSYVLDNVAPGEYRMTTTFNDHEIELAQYLGTAAIQAGQELTVDGALEPGQINGRIEFNQIEPQNVTLSLTDQLNGDVVYTTGITAFTFDKILEGNYTLKVENDNLASQLPANQVAVTIVPGDPLNQSLSIQPGLAITGTIRLGGKGLADQGIDYFSMDGGVEGQVISDEDGYFAVVVPQGKYSFYSKYQEHQTTNTILTKVDTKTFSGALDLNLRQSSKVTGVLFYDDNGNGLYDAEQEQLVKNQEVSFFNSLGAMTKTMVTEVGRYNIHLPSGLYSSYVMVQRAGEAGIEPYAALMTVQISFAERELNLGLRPAHDLMGSLVEGSGDSAKNVNGTVIATSARGTVLFPAVWGDFVLSLPSDTYTLDIDIYGYSIEEQLEVDLTGPKDLTIQVKPNDITLTGQVTWKDQPLIGATVSLMPFDHPEETVQQDVSRAGGYYSIGVPPGHYLVEVEKLEGNDRFSALTDILLPLGGGTVDLDLQADLRLQVTGKVTSDQVPVGGTLVFTSAEFPEQTFRIENRPIEGYEAYLARGTYYVTYDDGSTSDHLSLLQTVDVDASMTRDFILNSDDRWSAEVVNSVDLDRLGEKVDLVLHGAAGTLFITTDENAKIRVDMPAGDYTVEVDHPGYQSYTGSLTILSGVTNKEDVPLVPEPVAISGRVTYETPNGTRVGLETSPITFKIDYSESDLEYSLMTNETGYYQLDDVLPGRYDFIVDHTLADGSVRFKYDTTKTIRAGEAHQTYNRNINAEYHLHGLAYYDRDHDRQVDEGEVLEDTTVDIWTASGTSLVKSLKVDDQGAFSHYRVSGDYLLIAHGTTPGGATMVSHQMIALDQAVEIDQLLQRGVTLNATTVHNNKAINVQELVLTGPVKLSLEPVEGNVLTALPPGDYNLKVEHDDNSGTPDYFYFLDQNQTLTTNDDMVPLELQLEKFQSHGMEVVALSEPRVSTIVGSPINFTFKVTNTGHFEDVFRLDLGEVPSNWTVDRELGDEFPIRPGETRTVNITVTPDETVIPKIFMNLEANFSWSNDRDDDIEDIYEVFDLRVTPLQRPRPNFIISDLSVSGDRIEGITLEITATIASTRLDSGTHAVTVLFLVDDEPLNDPFNPFIIELDPIENEQVTASWKATRAGAYNIEVKVDPDNELAETEEEDNTYSQTETIEEESDGGWLENRWLAAGIAGLIFVLLVIILVMTNNIRRRSSVYGGYRKRR